MDPNDILPDFAFIDPKLLGQLIVMIVLWVQFSKEYIPDKFIKLYSLASALFFMVLVDACMEGGCGRVIPKQVAVVLMYGCLAASAAGIGYKALTPKNGGGKNP